MGRRARAASRALGKLGAKDRTRGLNAIAAGIRAAAPEVVIDASPARLDSVLALDVPIVTVGYRFAQRAGPDLLQRALEFAAAGGRRGDAAR